MLEFAATIKSTFEPVIQTSLYPRSQIDIFVQVIQQDGGLLQACINGTYTRADERRHPYA